jgi:hypothetical protein
MFQRTGRAGFFQNWIERAHNLSKYQIDRFQEGCQRYALGGQQNRRLELYRLPTVNP